MQSCTKLIDGGRSGLEQPSGEGARVLEAEVEELLAASGAVLGTRAIAYTLGRGVQEVSSTLSELSRRGVVERKLEHHTSGWRPRKQASGGSAGGLDGEAAERLIEYATLSPGASLSELLLALRLAGPDHSVRADMLHSALRVARENGEFRMVSYLLQEIVSMPAERTTAHQVAEVLRTMEPKRLRSLNAPMVRDYVLSRMEMLERPEERALARARLGELALQSDDPARAWSYLEQALEYCLEHSVGEWVPTILETLADVPGDYETTERTVELLAGTVERSAELGDGDTRLRVLATAAASLAAMGRHRAADNAIQSAIELSSQASPDARRVLEWCRARVSLASGKSGRAIQLLERALLLAENLNDQMAVSEVLDTLVSTMRSQPGYTVRSLSSIMERVARRAESSGNVSNQLYAMNQLTDIYSRTLQLRRAMSMVRRTREVRREVSLRMPEPLTDWYAAFFGYLSGEPCEDDLADLHMTGTIGILRGMLEGRDPLEEAARAADAIRGSASSSSREQAVLLALEAYARGFGETAARLAEALESIGRLDGGGWEPCWKLCLSGMLATGPPEADDFFDSAQVLARQMDRLLLTWLAMQAREAAGAELDHCTAAERALMLCELDDYVAEQMDGSSREAFLGRPHVVERRRRLEEMAGYRGPLPALKGKLSELVATEPVDWVSILASASGRFSNRSEISWSMEALGTLTGASRVQALQVRGGDVRVIESYGLGSNRLPGPEVTSVLLEMPELPRTIEDFCVTPFGSRRFVVVPTGLRTPRPGVDRRSADGPCAHGSYIVLEMDSPLDLVDPGLGFLESCLIRQITSALQLREREMESYYDAMTGAAIRSSWMHRLKELLETSVSERAPLAVFVLDVDHFKTVNDSFGHRAGDRVLREIVSAVSGSLRPDDIIGRLGGDEFGVILPSTAQEDARAIAERVCLSVSRSVTRPDHVPVTLSAGVTGTDSPGDRSELLIRRADTALYQSKQEGRNRVTLWTSDSDRIWSEIRPPEIFDTGDPGWDHALGRSVLELLARRRVGLQDLSETFRDLLRSELLVLEDAGGERSMVAPGLSRRIPSLITPGPPGRTTEHRSVLDRYMVLSRVLDGGGRLIVAWESAEEIPGSIRAVFGSLARLAGLLLKEHGETGPPERT